MEYENEKNCIQLYDICYTKYTAKCYALTNTPMGVTTSFPFYLV